MISIIRFIVIFHNLDELRKASWNGIPKQYRAQAWKLLCVCNIGFLFL